MANILVLVAANWENTALPCRFTVVVNGVLARPKGAGTQIAGGNRTVALPRLADWQKTIAPVPPETRPSEGWEAHHLIAATMLVHALTQDDLKCSPVVPCGVVPDLRDVPPRAAAAKRSAHRADDVDAAHMQ